MMLKVFFLVVYKRGRDQDDYKHRREGREHKRTWYRIWWLSSSSRRHHGHKIWLLVSSYP